MIRAVELTIFGGRLAAICEEMGAILGRSALSPNIRDRLDYSCALFDHNGHLIGQATHIPVHLGSMAFAMQDIVQSTTWAVGDMLILNDPFSGGTHLPDVTLIAPVHQQGELIGFAANRAHYADIGANQPGSMPLAGQLDEEGVLIRPLKVIKQDRLQQTSWQALLSQMRVPELVDGDFQAQVAANRRGRERLLALVDDLGSAQFVEQVQALQEYAEELVRQQLKEIPPGRYRFVDYLDGDGLTEQRIPIKLAVKVTEESIRFDFAGSSAQVAGNLNCPLSVTVAAVQYVMRCLSSEHTPACAGALRPVVVSAPLGSVLNAQAPAAVAAGNVETSMRVVDVVCGALLQAAPALIPAAGQGTMNNLAMGSLDADPERWDYYETLAGGSGAGAHYAGLDARQCHMTNTLNTPVEVLERYYPLRITRYAIRTDSGGSGSHRGGDGVVREYEFLRDSTVSLLTERRALAPWGVNQAAPGLPGANRLDGAPVPAKCTLEIKAGQRLTLLTPGGGGWSEPV